jgi:hypothetical protein
VRGLIVLHLVTSTHLMGLGRTGYSGNESKGRVNIHKRSLAYMRRVSHLLWLMKRHRNRAQSEK